jgi:predicted O-methyltransferase YrrM
MTAITDPLIAATLAALHHNARSDWRHLVPIAPRFFLTLLSGRDFMPAKTPATAYMAVSAQEGEFLCFLAKAVRAKQIVEFGCSFGISTIYLASAARDNGGRVITTEIEPAKCTTTEQNIRKAGLHDYVTILEGDALQTLGSVKGPVDFIFLDGAKHLYIPVLEMLRPLLRPGSIVVGDNVNMPHTRPYAERICAKNSGFTSIKLFGGRALVSCFSA